MLLLLDVTREIPLMKFRILNLIIDEAPCIVRIRKRLNNTRSLFAHSYMNYRAFELHNSVWESAYSHNGRGLANTGDHKTPFSGSGDYFLLFFSFLSYFRHS